MSLRKDFSETDIDGALSAITGKELMNKIIAQLPSVFEKRPEHAEAVAMRITQHPDERFRITLAESPIVGREEFSAVTAVLASETNYKMVRAAVAGNLNTPANILADLGEDNYYTVLEKVAANPNTPKTTLQTLFDRRDSGNSADVVKAIAANPNTPKEILIEIVDTYEANSANIDSYHHWQTYAEIGKNTGAPAHLLKRLSKLEYGERGWSVHLIAALAGNTSASAHTLDRLAGMGEKTALIVAQNPKTSAKTLHKIAETSDDPFGNTLKNVIGNPNTGIDTIKLIAASDIRDVRYAALDVLDRTSDATSKRASLKDFGFDI